MIQIGRILPFLHEYFSHFDLFLVDYKMLPCLDEKCSAQFVDEKSQKAHWEDRHRVSFEEISLVVLNKTECQISLKFSVTSLLVLCFPGSYHIQMFSEELWVYYKLQTRAQFSYGSGTQVSIQSSIVMARYNLGNPLGQFCWSNVHFIFT